MSTTAKPKIDLDSVCKKLSESTDRPAAEIKAEIEGLMQKFGYNLGGAIAAWKSDNKFLIAVDRKEYTARVIAKEPPRASTNQDGTQNVVGNIHFIYADPDTKETKFNQTTAWGQQRIDQLYAAFDLNKVYSFKGRLNEKGYLAWIRGINTATGAPDIKDIEGLPIAEVADVIDQYELVKGFVGKVIMSNNQIAGFELDDMGAAPPLTVWFGGKYAKMEPSDVLDVQTKLVNGIQVAAYGYISGTGPDVRMSASSIWFL